ncbi:MAG: 16S rRNA (cytosine(1402)-N(4))-methyltransferase RsmH [Patescibacteria group bacterium]
MQHISVLKEDVEKYLGLGENKVVLDATLGLGGHSLAILQKIGKKGKLIAFEQDERNLIEAQNRLKDFEPQVVYIHDNFCHLKARVTGYEGKIDAILFDLGLSSPHVDEADRGFSFMKEGPLDMRFDQRNKLTAEEVINDYPENKLADIFYHYGEESAGRQMAKFICERRKIERFTTTTQLGEFLSMKFSGLKKKGSHPATKVFQALRIEVNKELEILKDSLEQAFEVLKVGGQIVVISYHSLEDRIVKQFFKNLEKPPVSSMEAAVYRNFDDPFVENLTGKPVIPSEQEIKENPRSRSAKLRAYKKLR